jgi:PEP-CTERM motif
MRRLSIGTFTAIALALSVGWANATPIITSASRQVDVGDNAAGDVFGPNSPSTALGAFNDSVLQALGVREKTTSAEQSSDIDAIAGSFSGSGNAFVDFSVQRLDGVFAQSLYDVFFSLADNHSYSLSGNLAANVDGGRGEARFQLTGPTGLNLGVIEFGNQALSSSGTLLAGDYHLSVFAVMDNGGQSDDGYMGGSSSFDFNFQLRESGAPAPEPGTLALVFVGLVGLGLGKRKNRS